MQSTSDPSPSPQAKAKSVLNRRPAGYWGVFSNWWRSRYAALGQTRPTVNEVIDWYHQNADSSWPAGQVPSLKAVLRQSKGLRPIDGLKEYFREYRKKRKQQGGQPLTAGSELAQRRPRGAKRRNPRNAHADSTDYDDEEEELDAMEVDAAGSHSSDDTEDVGAEARKGCTSHRECSAAGAVGMCAAAPAAQPIAVLLEKADADCSQHAPSPLRPSSDGGACAAAVSSGSGGSHPASPNPDAGTSAAGLSDEAAAAVQAVFAAWHPGGLDAVAAVAATAAPPPRPPANWVGGRHAGAGKASSACGCTVASGQLPGAGSSVLGQGPGGMAPGRDAYGSAHVADEAPKAAFAFPPPALQYQYIRTVPVRRAPRPFTAFHGCSAASLPPISTPALGPLYAAAAIAAGVSGLLAPNSMHVPHLPAIDNSHNKVEAGSFHAYSQEQLAFSGLQYSQQLHRKYPNQPDGCDSAARAEGRRSSSAVKWPPVWRAGEQQQQQDPCALPQESCEPYMPQGCAHAGIDMADGPGLHLPGSHALALPAGGRCNSAEEGSACSSSLFPAYPAGCSMQGQAPVLRHGGLNDQQKTNALDLERLQQQQQFCPWSERPLCMSAAGSHNSVTDAVPASAADVPAFLSANGTDIPDGSCDEAHDAFDQDLAAAWECFVACTDAQETVMVF